jgi:uncharacterized membrane protein
MNNKKLTSSPKIAHLAMLSALAVIIRQVFQFIPNFQPVSAFFLAIAICFGLRESLLVLIISILVTSCLNGYGLWTPIQILVYALLIVTFKMLFFNFKARMIFLSLFGFIYGITTTFLLSRITGLFIFKSSFITALPFNFAHSLATISSFPIFLLILKKSWQKTSRIHHN